MLSIGEERKAPVAKQTPEWCTPFSIFNLYMEAEEWNMGFRAKPKHWDLRRSFSAVVNYENLLNKWMII